MGWDRNFFPGFFLKWDLPRFPGKGIVRDCVMKGVRGVVDRRTVDWSQFEWDPVESRESHVPGIFELERFSVEDLVVTVLSPAFRPYTISVFSADLPLFRQEWILYDIMAADSVVGMFDNCLFSIHKVSDAQERAARWLMPPSGPGEGVGIPMDWRSSKVSRLRIDGVPIDFFNHGVEGPFGWITAGTLDMDVRIRMPEAAPKNDDLLAAVAEKLAGLRGRGINPVEEVALARPYEKRYSEELDKRVAQLDFGGEQGSSNPSPEGVDPSIALALLDPLSFKADPSLRMLVDVRLNNLKASVPLQTDQMSYLTNALVRPVVAYMNANRTSIPLSFTGEIPMVS